jgi:hypothetical protein
MMLVLDNARNDVITQAAMTSGLGIAGTVPLVAGGFVSDLQRQLGWKRQVKFAQSDKVCSWRMIVGI